MSYKPLKRVIVVNNTFNLYLSSMTLVAFEKKKKED